MSTSETKRQETSAEKPILVHIGNKYYPVNSDNIGEKIDFGDDIWWQEEGYTGLYEMSDEDLSEMQKIWGGVSVQIKKSDAWLVIGNGGKVHLKYFGTVYEGVMQNERYYGTNAVLYLESQTEFRSIEIMLEEGVVHDEPSRIYLYSEGVPATNEPPKQMPIKIYLTKTDKAIPEEYDSPVETADNETSDQSGKITCPICKTKVENARFCSECGAPLQNR